jgi:ABC-2 type transport system permease protein
VIGLARSETRRLLSRRLLRVLTILALLGILVSVVIVAAKSHKPTAAQQAVLQQQYQQEVADCIAQRYFRPSDIPPGETLQSLCAEVYANQTIGNGFTLSGLPDILRGTSFILLVIGLVIGASAVGADWQSGSMATLLLWEPRRIRVLLIRALVVAVTVFVLAILLQAALSLLLTLVASTRGSTLGTGGDFTHTVVGVGARVAVMTAILSLVGLAISTVGRTTAASLGVVFVYLALVESLLHGLIPRLTPWLLSVNTAIFVDGHAQDVGDTRPVHLTPAHSTVIVIAYAVILLAAAGLFFRRRDVS